MDPGIRESAIPARINPCMVCYTLTYFRLISTMGSPIVLVRWHLYIGSASRVNSAAHNLSDQPLSNFFSFCLFCGSGELISQVYASTVRQKANSRKHPSANNEICIHTRQFTTIYKPVHREMYINRQIRECWARLLCCPPSVYRLLHDPSWLKPLCRAGQMGTCGPHPGSVNWGPNFRFALYVYLQHDK